MRRLLPTVPALLPAVVPAVVLALLLAGCAAPVTAAGEAPRTDLAQQQAAAPTRAAPPMSDPLPAQLVPNQDGAREADSEKTGGVRVDLGCRSNADCAIKNVGSCCGERPACVNVNSPTDPQGVQALCAEQGMVSTCGFPVVTSCQCVQGSCQGSGEAPLR